MLAELLQILSGMVQNNTDEKINEINTDYTRIVDDLIYPRLKYKERYMETPEGPY